VGNILALTTRRPCHLDKDHLSAIGAALSQQHTGNEPQCSKLPKAEPRGRAGTGVLIAWMHHFLLVGIDIGMDNKDYLSH
ncbi:MAG TPA: hypothetical protein DD459_15700, partial [Halieaceae bacterium]|nr:hypothetical protein [Halieaceae bacterium]